MRCAVVHPKTNEVVNVIVADARVDVVPGFVLVDVPEGSPVSVRYLWQPPTMLGMRKGYFYPTAELQAEMDAVAAKGVKDMEALAISDEKEARERQ
jgi:hypothetical protein